MPKLEEGVVLLDGHPYEVEEGSWQGRDVVDFSPKVSTPEGGVIYNDLQMYQPIAVQTDFSHGFGFLWQEDPAGYMYTTGNIDTRHKGMAMLMTKSVESSATDAGIQEGFVVFKDMVYRWGANGCARYTAANGWEDINVIFNKATAGYRTSFIDAAAAASPKTCSMTLPATGKNRLLMVSILMDTGRTVSGVTWNGVGMTKVDEQGTDPYQVIYRLVNPTADGAAHNLVITYTGGTTAMLVEAQVFLYVDQSTPLGTVVKSAATSTDAFAGSLSSAVGDICYDFVAKQYIAASTDSQQVGAGQTQQMKENLLTSYTVSSSVEVGATTVLMQWSWTTNKNAWQMAVPVKFSANTTRAVKFMFTNGEYLFMCPDDARIQRSSNGGITAADWDSAGVDANAIDFHWLVMHGGYIYAGVDDTNRVHYDSNDNLSQLAGDAAGDTAEIYVGTGASNPTLGAISYLEKLFVPRMNGLWGIGDDRVARVALNFGSETSTDNFASMAVANGYMYFPIRDRVMQYNGSRLSNVTPRALNDDWPYQTLGKFDNFITVDDLLYCSARTNETTYSEMILCYDGVGWHRVATPIADGDGSISGMYYDPVNRYLWYHVYKPTAATSKTYYIRFSAQSNYPYGSFDINSTDDGLITSRIEAGYRRVDKSAIKLYVDARNVTSARYIRASYWLDGSTDGFVVWDDVVEDGVTMLTFPGGNKSIEFNYIVLRFELITDSATETPVLEGWALMGMLRPDTKWGYSFAVRIENAKQKKNLREARNSKMPVQLITLLGEESWGYVTQLQETQVAPDGEGGGALEALVTINYVETLGENLSALTVGTDVDVTGPRNP